MILNQDRFTSKKEAHLMRIMTGMGVFGIIIAFLSILSLIIEFPIAAFFILGFIGISYGLGCIAAYFERRKNAKNRE